MPEGAMESVAAALCAIRAPVVPDERHLQGIVAAALDAAGIAYEREARIAPRCRVDFLCAGGIAIEVKRGKPYPAKLLPQLRRYASSEHVKGMFVVVERTASIPDSIGGKPCRLFGLNRLWGIAI